ncbi:MAG: RNA polymerase sigma factor [Bacteroidales bacterium]
MTTLEFNKQITDLYKNLEYFALSLTQNEHDAKDLLQETYLKALKYREKFVHSSNLKAWLFTIMKNTFINNYRRKVKARTIVDTTDDLYYLNSLNETRFASPESKINHQEINKQINNLDYNYRVPFEMHTKGFKYKEIAEELDLSIGTVKSRIFFTRRKLMKRLKDFQN